MKRIVRIIVKSVAVVMLLLCVVATWFYIAVWCPGKTIASESRKGEHASREKIRDACHKLLSHPDVFRSYAHHYASMKLEKVGNKDSIPILIRAGKRQTRICRMMYANHEKMGCTCWCYLDGLYTLTAMPLGSRFSPTEISLEEEYEIWERWWNETGRHLPFDEERGQLMLQENLNATIRVRVVDEEGEPISGVYARVYNIFDTRSDYKPGLTDADGVHEVRLYNIYRIGGVFKKEGYYTSTGYLWEAPEWGIPPANTKFTVVMKRITEPLPSPRLADPVGPFVFKADD